MTPEKLDKYRNGNFKLKNKHIFAKKNLIKIRNYLLATHTLVGGSVDSIVTTINNMDIISGFDLNKENKYKIKNDYDDDYTYETFNKSKKYEYEDSSEFKSLHDEITTLMDVENNKSMLINKNDQAFKDLIQADRELLDVFNTYKELKTNDNYAGLADPEGTKNQILDIQKNLFKLQVKIIFSKLRAIKKSNIIPLLSIINNKIVKMNSYIDAQEQKYDEIIESDNKGVKSADTNAETNDTIPILYNEIISNNELSPYEKRILNKSSKLKKAFIDFLKLEKTARDTFVDKLLIDYDIIRKPLGLAPTLADAKEIPEETLREFYTLFNINDDIINDITKNIRDTNYDSTIKNINDIKLNTHYIDTFFIDNLIDIYYTKFINR